MGMNYYLAKNYCEKCERYDPVHIGKSSAGWHFSLRIYPDDEEKIMNLEDWKKLFSLYLIFDQNSRCISKEEMLHMITERYKDLPLSMAFCRRNSCIEGFNNLARHKVGDGLCVGHGDGTWDYVIGEFS